MKTFVARVRVGEELYGHGTGRSKKEAEQGAAETAYGELRPTRTPSSSTTRSTSKPDPCPSCPRSRSSARASQRHVTGATITAVEVLHPRPLRRDPRSGRRLRRRAGRPAHRGASGAAASTSGCARLDAPATRLLGHLGMSGQMLLQHPGAPDERHLRVRFVLAPPTTGPLEMRFVDQRMFGGLLVSDGRSRAADRDRAHRPRPARPGVRRGRRRAARAPPYGRDQAPAARPDAGVRGRQHLRRRGAVARPAPRRPARRPAHRRPGARGRSATRAT